MSATNNREQFRLGFLAAIEDAERGYVGGLLITNRFGRPLEFQCTAPVKPNRTQQILYGPTLVPYVLAELIGRTLVEKVGVKPHLVLIERSDLLELRDHIQQPVACVASASGGDPTMRNPHELEIGGRRLRFHDEYAADCETVRPHLPLIPREADLQEPFERVREALQETIRGAARAA